MPTRAQLKSSAKNAMRRTRPNVPNIFLIALVYLVIDYVLTILDYKVMFPGMRLMDIFMDISTGEIPSVQPNAFSQLIRLAISLMSMMLGIGMTSVCLSVSRFKYASFGNLFDPFGMFLKFLWLNILINIFTFLWSLLFIIPGIVAAYRYSMAVYIMLDNPEYSASECIRLSKEMMDGKKLDLFILELSFIGWLLLTVIPFVGIYVMPYMEITRANFYNALCGYIPETDYTVHDDNAPGDGGGTGWDNKKDPWD